MSGADRGRRLLTALLLLSVVSLAAALAFQDLRAFDYWWHLRTGQLIAETGAVPKVDPYSYTVPGARWVDIHWLHQLGTWGAYQLGGHAGVVVAKGVMVLLLVGVLGPIGYRRERPVVSAVAIALMLLIAADRFMPRPELPTFVCFAAVLALLDRFERRPDAWVYAILAVQLVWVNVHGLFALGVAVCGIHFAAELLRPLVVPGEALRRARLRRLASVTLLAALVSLANPNGLDGALYPLQQLGMIGPPEDRGVFGSLIAELLPPIDPRRPMSAPGIVLAATLGALSFLAMLLNWRRIRAADPLVWVAFLYLALGAQRNGALFAIAAVPILVRNLNEFLEARGGRPRIPLPVDAVAAAGVLALTVATATGELLPRIGSTREPGFGVMDVFYPTGAADWIERSRPEGPICHHMADGGYLIWRLFPDYPVMVDGRLEVYGSEKFLEYQVARSEQFRVLDERHEFGTVIVHYSLVNSSELLRWLHLNSNWRLAFVDDVAAVFERIPEGRTGEDVDVDGAGLFAPLDESDSVSNLIRMMARTNFYTALHRYDTALTLWKETIERFPDLPQGPVIHAFLLQKNGFGAAAEAILRAELEARPKDPALHTQVGDLRLETGDREAARTLYDTALERDPNFPYAMFRRAQLAEADGDGEVALRLYLRVAAQGVRAGSLAPQARARAAALSRGL